MESLIARTQGPRRRCRTRRGAESAEGGGRRSPALPEIGQIIRRSVGERLVGLGPDILRGIEFGRVRREVMDVQARVTRDKGLNLATPVDGAAIPEQIHGAQGAFLFQTHDATQHLF